MKKYILPLSFFLILNFCLSADVEILWEKQTAIEVNTSHFWPYQRTLAQAPNGTLIAASDKLLLGLNPANGEVIWEHTGNGLGSPSVGNNNIIYITESEHNEGNHMLYAISITNGETLWSKSFDDPIYNMLISDKNEVYVKTNLLFKDNDEVWHSFDTIHVFDGDDGALITRLEYTGGFWSIIADENNLYVEGLWGVVEDHDSTPIVVLDRNNGSIENVIRHTPSSEGVYTGNNITTSDKYICFFNLEFGYIVDKESGELIVKLETIGSHAKTISDDIIFYVENHNNQWKVISYDIGNSERLWEFNSSTGGFEFIPLENGDLIYFNDEHGMSYLDSTDLFTDYLNGTPRRSPAIKYHIPNGIIDALVSSTGVIYAMSVDGKIISINGSVGTGDAPWAMWGGNAQRTFFSRTSGDEVEEVPNTQAATMLSGWSWMETYPLIFNESSDTWFYLMPVVIDGTATNWLYNYSTEVWTPLATE